MKKICFVTGTRADYGIMAPIMGLLKESPDIELQVVATNMHLSPKFGMTINEIEKDGFVVNKKIESLSVADTPKDIVRSMALVQSGLADAFETLSPDIVVILGDRYEALAAASAAVVFGIPIAHLHGGEITKGAFDDSFRNAITMLSTWHFSSTPEYCSRIIGMGINRDKVFHSGAPGAEPLQHFRNKNISEIFQETTGFSPNTPFIILAVHPVTMSPDLGMADVMSIISSLKPLLDNGYKVLITMPNSDPGNVSIAKQLMEWQLNNPTNVTILKSLGSELFHFALSKARFIIGNSSAALIEAPSYKIPSINVGDRQKGRTRGVSVLDARPEVEEITSFIEKALDEDFHIYLKNLSLQDINPYFKKDSASFIADKLKKL